MIASRIRVTGLVQGVGFRPFVFRLARELDLAGWVRNDGLGVEIAAEGEPASLDALLERLRLEAPHPARIDGIEARAAAAAGSRAFVIRASGAGKTGTAIGHDSVPCAECLAELFDPDDRRHRHALISCSHCGPRYTVTRHLPYDRANTSLAEFPLCADCRAEYEQPDDRRFHAETLCCPECGPRLVLRDSQGETLAGDPIAETLRLIRAGGIVAIKGLGGYHLVCDAANADAVARLRLRKAREEKPFAVLLANVCSVRALAEVDASEARLLCSDERPIVLVRKRPGCDARLPGVAPGLARLGAMLPATPIQFLLFHEAAGRPPGTDWLDRRQDLVLVATSANPGGEALVIGEDEAFSRLAGIVDAYLSHDRAIVTRCDDSIVRDGRLMRRARGYTPRPIRLSRSGPDVIAFGGGLKNTVCVTRGNEAFVSQHVGDLASVANCRFHDEVAVRLLDLLEVVPERVACDLHPDFHSSRAAANFAEAAGLPLIMVQHHHAHVAAVLAEHGHDAPALGLAADGFGLGNDGRPWGGELLRVDGADCRRFGHLAPLPLPGGDRAAREPWRMAAAVLWRLDRGDEIAHRFSDQPAAARLADLLERGCIQTSSLGRIFDAAAGLLGVRASNAFEAQAAMLLEGLAAEFGPAPPAADARIEAGEDGLTLDLLPLLSRLAEAGDVAQAAAQFHSSLACALADWLIVAAEQSGLGTVVLAGGCLLNDVLTRALLPRLSAAGLRVLLARELPPNDGGLSLGQAWVARQFSGA